ncbi:MAG: hypothetical protein ACRDHN_07190, partial [Thermomicrobiales bacterium]
LPMGVSEGFPTHAHPPRLAGLATGSEQHLIGDSNARGLPAPSTLADRAIRRAVVDFPAGVVPAGLTGCG